eukprot:TRINITY_DN9528_c0_g1_i4.p1 TRINITY_DN9528_c0_g1~~TRINITY_DN9528_c0_g1_i4.p1  ORF type:complete len:365 (+),score=36.72 TRINITY_DN9528_c0_g1_i4:3-1097(+)
MALNVATVLQLTCFIASVSSATSTAEPQHSWIFKTNKTIVYSHMSMILALPNSNILAAWQASNLSEGCADQRILLARSQDGGETWTVPHVAQAGFGYAVWGPVLHYDNATSTVWMFFSASGSYRERPDNTSCKGLPRTYPGGDIMTKTSQDYGHTWSQPRKILSFESRGQVGKVTANHLLVSGSRWLLPFWQEKRSPNDSGPMCGAVLVSDDKGDSWTPHGCLHNEFTWLIENTLATISPNTIYQLFRTQVGAIYQSWSYDNGDTWTNATALPLNNPDSKTCLTQTSTGEQILAYNPSKLHRTPVSLARSSDGRSWTRMVDLDADPSGSFAYPTPIIVSGQVLTSYTASCNGTHGIKLAVVSLN